MRKSDKNLKRFDDHNKEELAMPCPIAKVDTIQDDNVDDSSISSFDSSNSSEDGESGFIQNQKKESDLQDDTSEDDHNNHSESESQRVMVFGFLSSRSSASDQKERSVNGSLTSSRLFFQKGHLADALPHITEF
ncbi:unnamed protein product [Cochlearia groenlandica]